MIGNTNFNEETNEYSISKNNLLFNLKFIYN